MKGMPMNSTHVSVRLSGGAWTRYSKEAQAKGMALATYLRRHLEEQDRMLAEIAALRATLEQSTPVAAPAANATPSIGAGALVEVLLLLRSLVGPQKATVAQKEVERRGLETWR
jgi:hypothetical protein